MQNSIIKECLEILNRDDVKNRLKSAFNPVTDSIVCQIYPYIYVILLIVFIIFILILAILVLLVSLLRNKTFITSFISPLSAMVPDIHPSE